MFSGIIDRIGEVASTRETPGGRALSIRADDYWSACPLGASIAIDGVCLTVTSIDTHIASFDVVAESLRRTTLGDLRPGAPVNLQKSLTPADRIDGHFVQGHVNAVATIARVESSHAESKWWFSVEGVAMDYVIPKGAIAVDGISLTIADVRDGLFSVALIPTTLDRTTLGRKKSGARVNIETDILARTVVHYLQSLGITRGDTPALMEALRTNGFA